MDLPNYFIADMPPEASVNTDLVRNACQTLKRNRNQYLEYWPTSKITRTLEKVGREWLMEDSPFRQAALRDGPSATGFSPETLQHGLDLFFEQLTSDNLEALLRQELGHPSRLDEFRAAGEEMAEKRVAWAHGPQLLAQIAPGNIPTAAISQMVMGLLVRSAQFVKCATGQTFLPRLFAHSIYDAEAKLGACLEIAEWKGGAEEIENALFAESDCIVVTGSDETLADVRRRAPLSSRLLGYGTKVSLGYISKHAIEKQNRVTVQQAARAIAEWDQRGCLSPHDIYVEESRVGSAEYFAVDLANELEVMETKMPRGKHTPRDAAAIATRRAFYEVRAADSQETRMWASPDSTAWTIVLESEPRFQTSCLNRFIYIKGVPDLETALHGAEPVRDQVSTVGLACGPDERTELARRFSRWGARRICPLGEMQNPPLAWRHDGRPALGDLLTWCDWEK